MQPLAIVVGAAFTVAVATALGGLLLGDACREYPVRFVAGSSVLSLLIFVLCAVHLAYPLVFLAVGAVLFRGFGPRASQLPQHPDGLPPPPSQLPPPPRGIPPTSSGLSSRPSQATPPPSGLPPRPGWLPSKTAYVVKTIFVLIFATYFLLYLMNSMAPEVSPDGSTYHLGLVGSYLRGHGFHRITWNFYASLPQGMEMLFLFAYAFGKHSAAAMVHFAFLLALAWEMFLYGKRAGFPLAAASGAALVFASPVVGIDGISAYNDVALAAIAFTLFFLLQVWSEERNPRLLLAIGLVAAFGFSVKYTAWLGVLYAIGFVAWKSRRLRDVAVVTACAAALALPWLVKNWLWVANPVAPFFNQYIRNPYVTVDFEQNYRKYFALYDLASRWQIPKQVTVIGATGGLLGPVFLLAPLALVTLRRRQGRQLWLAALVFGANYFTNIGTRFLIPMLPFVALAMGLALEAIPALAVAMVLLHAVLSWPTVIPRYSMHGAWRLQKIVWKEALRVRDTQFFMRSHLGEYEATRMADQNTPPSATIFTYRAIPEAYTTRRVLVEYQAARNQYLGMMLRTAFSSDFQPTLRMRWRFPRQALHGVRLVQTNTAPDVWSIHELRVFDGPGELPRRPQWRLRAQPFPWDVQEAFDNSPLTFWRSWEAIHPGMFVEVDFNGDEQADSVLVESAPNQSAIRVRLEGRDASGAWRLLAARPELSDAPAPLGLRRAAAAELKRRGVDYLLMFDEEFGADDFRNNTALWGIRQVAAGGKARLYQLP